jgi:hypothetical protein
VLPFLELLPALVCLHRNPIAFGFLRGCFCCHSCLDCARLHNPCRTDNTMLPIPRVELQKTDKGLLLASFARTAT